MTLNEFVTKIKEEIHPDLNFRQKDEHDGVAYIDLGKQYLGVAMPSKGIFEEKSDEYGVELMGKFHAHPTIQEVYERIQSKVKKFSDPEIIKLMQEKE